MCETLLPSTDIRNMGKNAISAIFRSINTLLPADRWSWNFKHILLCYFLASLPKEKIWGPIYPILWRSEISAYCEIYVRYKISQCWQAREGRKKQTNRIQTVTNVKRTLWRKQCKKPHEKILVVTRVMLFSKRQINAVDGNVWNTCSALI